MQFSCDRFHSTMPMSSSLFGNEIQDKDTNRTRRPPETSLIGAIRIVSSLRWRSTRLREDSISTWEINRNAFMERQSQVLYLSCLVSVLPWDEAFQLTKNSLAMIRWRSSVRALGNDTLRLIPIRWDERSRSTANLTLSSA